MATSLPFFTWLKEAVTNLLSLIIGVLLILIAMLLLSAALPAALLHYGITIHHKKQKAREIMLRSGSFFYMVALALDHLGNVAYPAFWNWLFLKETKTPFLFGVPGQSLSQILGWNFKLDNLSPWGANLYHDLDVIDTDHCEKAIQKTMDDAQQYLEKCRSVQARIATIERTQAFLTKYQ